MINKFNGIDVVVFQEFVKGVVEDVFKCNVCFNVKMKWDGQICFVVMVNYYLMVGVKYECYFEIVVDELIELFGQNLVFNLQELLMVVFNVCLIVGYVVNVVVMGIIVYSLEIEMDGELDLCGFFGLDESVNLGYDEVIYVVCLNMDVLCECLEELYVVVIKILVNLVNFFKVICMVFKLEVVEG